MGNFRVGQKVVCVDQWNFKNQELIDRYRLRTPVIDKEYTVRGYCGSGLLLLEEIVNPPFKWSNGFYEGGWFPSRFRAIEEDLTASLASSFTELPTEQEVVNPQYA